MYTLIILNPKLFNHNFYFIKKISKIEIDDLIGELKDELAQ